MNAVGSIRYTLTQGHRPWPRREIDVLGIDLFHCECLQSRGLKPENSADEACFHFSYIFRWIVKFIPRARCAPRAKKNSKKNHLTDKVSSSTSVVVQSLVAQLKVKRFPIGRSMVRTLPRVLFFVSFFFRSFLFVRFESSFSWLHSSWQERGTTFYWTSCWIKFATMVSLWVGNFSKVKLIMVRKRAGTRTRSTVAKKTCSQLQQWKGRLLGLRTFFALNPSETLTQRGARASQLWRSLTRVYDVPFWYLPAFVHGWTQGYVSPLIYWAFARWQKSIQTKQAILAFLRFPHPPPPPPILVYFIFLSLSLSLFLSLSLSLSLCCT